MAHKEFNVHHLAKLKQLGVTYAKGIAAASRKDLSELVFHKSAIIFGTTRGTFQDGPISQLYDAIESHGASPDMTYHVDVVDATPATAVLRVHLDNQVTGNAYIDYLSAVKIDDNWQVVAKVFQEYKN